MRREKERCPSSTDANFARNASGFEVSMKEQGDDQQ
jgi:hypothetical protein